MGVPQSIKGYEPLSEVTAIELAKELHLFDRNENLSCKEIGDGNLNYVFQVKNETTRQSIIIKQALPYAKVVGESWPLTLHRATIESNALKTYTSITPQFVPKVYHTDSTLAITVMEDLSHYKILRTGLIEGCDFPKVAEHIGTYLAKTLFFTSDFGLNQQEKKERVKEYINPELCKITEELVFTDPFYNKDTNDFEVELSQDVESIWRDDSLKLEVAKLKKVFLTQSEALIHGDLHTGSIFVTETETKVIDPEFAFYGPIGFDVGLFFGNLLLNAISRSKEEQDARLKTIDDTWKVFTQTFKALWKERNVEPYSEVRLYVEYVLEDILENAIGFAGCEVIRRTIGLAHVADLDGIENSERRISAKRQALSLGRRLILQRKYIKSLKDLTLV